MKKLLSIILASMMFGASFSSVLAADEGGELTFTPSIYEYNMDDEESVDEVDEIDEGSYISVRVDLAGDQFNSFGAKLLYDNSVFEYENIAMIYKSKLPSLPTVGLNADGMTLGFANATDVETKKSSGAAQIVAFELIFAVKTDVKADDYTFEFVADIVDGKEVKPTNAAKATLAATYESDSVYVNGTKSDAPSIVEATKVVEDKNNKADKAEGEAYTQGFKVTVTGNDQVVTAVPFTLTADGTTKAFAGFTGLEITGATPAVLGLNVKKVPADKTVTAEFSLTIAE